MTKDEFIASYCERSGITRERFDRTDVALPCACQYEDCEGWAAVSNNALSIKNHTELYSPEPALGKDWLSPHGECA